jgi:hypothetical protein
MFEKDINPTFCNAYFENCGPSGLSDLGGISLVSIGFLVA